MENNLVIDLAECTEFRDALRMHTPAIVHGGTFLLTATLASALGWMALTRASLVVTAPGEIRPASDPAFEDAIFSPDVSVAAAGKVTDVRVSEGDEVKKGDILVQLDAEATVNEIAKLESKIADAHQRIAEIEKTKDLTKGKFLAAVEKKKAEYAEAGRKIATDKARRQSDIESATASYREASESLSRLRMANKRVPGVVATQEVVKAETALVDAKAKLEKARLPVNEDRLQVIRREYKELAAEQTLAHQKLADESLRAEQEMHQAIIELKNKQHELSKTTIRSLYDGVVTRCRIKVGDVLEVGKIDLSLARCSGIEFEAKIPNADIAFITAGMPVKIKIDALDYQKYGVVSGWLRSVAPDSFRGPREGASQKKAADRSYVVKISVDDEVLRHNQIEARLKLGMTGKAEIVTDNESLLRILLRKMRRKISLS